MGLDVDDLGCWELKLDDRHTGFFQVLQETDFGRLQEHQAASLAFFATGCTADSVDVVSGVIWGVELDNPVHRGDLNCQNHILKVERGKAGTYIQSSCCNIGTDQGSLFSVTEFEKGVGPLLLLLLSMQLEHRQINVVKQFCVVFHTVTTREEHNNLFLEVPLEEREQEQEPLVSLTNDVSLFQTLYRAVLLAVVHVDIQRTRTERYPGQILDLGGLGGREEHGLAFLRRQDLDDLAHLVFETNFQNSVCFVDDEGLEVLEYEALGVLQMVEQSSGSRNQQVDTLGELLCLCASVRASDHDTVGLGVVGHDFSGHSKNL